MKIFTAQIVQKILNGSREGRQPPAVSSKGLRGHPEAAEVHHHGGGAAVADGGDQPQLEAGDVFLHPWNAFLAHAHIHTSTYTSHSCLSLCLLVCMYVRLAQLHISNTINTWLMLWHTKWVLCALVYFDPKKKFKSKLTVFSLSNYFYFLVLTLQCTETLILYFFVHENMKKKR